MITIICGVPRAGKTALMTSFALRRMIGVQAHRDVLACKKLLKPFNEGGFHYLARDDHLVCSDYTIKTGAKGRIINYEIDGFYLGLPNEQHPTMFLPPKSQIFLDEAQKYFNSRDGSSKLADFVSRFYELHGHNRMNVTMTVQRPKLIDLNIRELAAEVYYVEELDHAIVNGRIVESEWTCRYFNNSSAAISYIESGRDKHKAGDKVRFIYKGNIFKHYNSYAFQLLFFKDRYDSDFNLRHAVAPGFTVAEVIDFINQHDYAVPETYFKNYKPPKGEKKIV